MRRSCLAVSWRNSAAVPRCIAFFFNLAAVLTTIAANQIGTASDGAEPSWQVLHSMPEGAVFASSIVGNDGRIYVMSGFKGPETEVLTPANRVYDPRTDLWVLRAPVPTPRCEPGSALAADGTIYLVGGNPSRGRKLSSKMNAVEAYNPLTDLWTVQPVLPTPRTGLSVVAAKDSRGKLLIYAMGGRNFDMPGNGLNTVEAFDPETRLWTVKSSMPTNLHGMAASLGPDGRIYVAGGTSSTVIHTDALYIYDPREDRWTAGLRLPYGQECAAATFTPGLQGEVVFIGGWPDPRKIPLRSVIAFNPRSQTWRALPSLPVGTAAGSAVTIDESPSGSTIYCLGGMPGPTALRKLILR
jgi:N-acetylneuraminic acid mutarotase